MKRTVVYYLDTVSFGGLEQSLLETVAHLDRSRFQPVLAHTRAPGLDPLLTGARALDVPLWPLPVMRGVGGLGGMRTLMRGLRRTRAAIFHAHLNWPLACHHGLAAAAAARVPAIFASHHAFVEIPWRRSILLERALSHGVDRYLAVSRAVAERLLETFAFRRSAVHVVHTGVSLERFLRPAAEELRQALGGGRDRAIILAVGRLDQQKGQAYLVRAAAHLHDTVVVLAGDGPERTALEREAHALGVQQRVRFLGRRTDIPDLLAASDIVVQPSATFEGLGLAAIEGMAAQKPVVVTATGGPTEVVIDGVSGIVVPPRDVGALVLALRRLLVDGALAGQLAKAGRARAEGFFSAARMVERFEAVYDDVLAGSARNARRC